MLNVVVFHHPNVDELTQRTSREEIISLANKDATFSIIHTADTNLLSHVSWGSCQNTCYLLCIFYEAY